MDRRRFVAIASGVAITAATGGLAGCARLLDGTGRSEQGSEKSEGATGASEPATGGAAPSQPRPDLVVFKGEDPGANVRAAVEALGGMGRFVKRDARVVVKPNVMISRGPEYGATTNPEVVSAIIAMCLEAGAREVVVLDRPVTEARPAFDVSGIAEATAKAGGNVKLLSARNYDQVAIPRGRLLTTTPLVADVLEADTFINIPIAKTHDMAGLTMSMKNLMGILGGERGTMHQDFPQKIVDLNTKVKPDLVILDAYRMMVRNGPTGGDLSDVKLAKTVVAGTSPVSVDAMGATLFGWQPDQVPYLKLAAEQGLGIIDLGTLSVVTGQA